MPTPASPWTDLGDGVRVRQSRAFWMNSAVLLDPEHTVVVDPGVLPSELDEIARAVAAAEPLEITLFFTHAHWDHVLGGPWWPKAQVLAHDRLGAETTKDRETILGEARALAEKHGERWERGFEPIRVDVPVSGLHFTKLGPWRLVFRDAPGHSDSQLSMHLPDQGVLFAADMLSDVEIPILNQRPCGIYRRTLEPLVPLAENGAIETLVPGHGSIARGRAAVLERLRRDLDYLEQLEGGVRRARKQGLTLAEAREQLAAMEYLGKRSVEYPTVEFHLGNVKFAYEQMSAEPKPRRRVPGPPGKAAKRGRPAAERPARHPGSPPDKPGGQSRT